MTEPTELGDVRGALPQEPPRLAWPGVTAVLTLVLMSIERAARGRRLIILMLLFLLPSGIAFLSRTVREGSLPPEAEEVLVFYLISQALVPLTALVLASSMIQDEVEEQTLTYLLVRPIPRWLIYVAKLTGTVIVAAGVTAVFTTLTLTMIHAGEPDFEQAVLLEKAPRIAALFSLAMLTYSAIFGCLSLFVRRVMVIGVSYILLFEGLFANIDFVVRKATVIFYERVLAERWLDIHVSRWSIKLKEAPSGLLSLGALLGIALVTTIIASVLISVREFRVKTPEGN